MREFIKRAHDLNANRNGRPMFVSFLWINGLSFLVICTITFLVTLKYSTHLLLAYWIMKKCKYHGVFCVLTQSPIFVFIIMSKLQLIQCWCRMMLFFTISNNNLWSAFQQSTIKSFISSYSISQVRALKKKRKTLELFKEEKWWELFKKKRETWELAKEQKPWWEFWKKKKRL